MEKELEQIADIVCEKISIQQKEVLTTKEAAQYMGVATGYLLKLTMKKEIPYFKPRGKMLYFNRKEIEQWLQRNRIYTDEELTNKAQKFCQKKGGAI